MGERHFRRRRRLRTATRRKFLIAGAATAVVAGGGAAWILGRERKPAYPVPELKPVRLTLVRSESAGDGRQRAALIPPEMLPFSVLQVHGPGDVTLNNSLLDGFLARYPEVQASVAHVSLQGSDQTGRTGDRARPFLTIPAALRHADTIIVDDGSYAPFAFDHGPKLVRARNPGKVSLTVPSGTPHRIVDPSRQDRDGFPSRVPLSGGMRPGLEAFYQDDAGLAQLQVLGGALCLHGIDLEGVTVRAEGGEAWVSNFTSFCAPGFAFAAVGGELFLETGRIHASMWDAWNCDWANGRGAIVAAGIETTEAGDSSVFGRGDAFNRQAGSSHSGYLAAFGCVARRSMGQEFADTSVGDVPNTSWYVGCIVGDDSYSRIDGGLGFHFVGTETGGREAFLDTCRAEGLAIPLLTEAGATAFTFACNFEEGYSYDPEAPETARLDAERARTPSESLGT